MPEPVENVELERIRTESMRRDRELPREYYSLSSPPNLFFRQGQERALLGLLIAGGYLPLGERRILDVGCGDGRWMRTYTAFGADVGKLAGIDLVKERLDIARRDNPGADLRLGSAGHLPWEDESFDLVSQYSAFTSMLDEKLRRQVAGEMVRVLKPGGAVLWCDFMFDNPMNPNVRGISAGSVRRLFPRCEVRSRRVTLAPPLARWVVPRSWAAAQLLEWLKIFNTHLFALIRSVPGAP